MLHFLAHDPAAGTQAAGSYLYLFHATFLNGNKSTTGFDSKLAFCYDKFINKNVTLKLSTAYRKFVPGFVPFQRLYTLHHVGMHMR